MSKKQIPSLTFKAPPPDGALPFEINSFETMAPLAQSQLPHRIQFYEIAYITAGQGFHVIDFVSYPLQPPTVFFISPGQVHFYQRKTPITGYVLLFTEDFLLSMFGERTAFHKFDFFHGVQQSPVLRVKPDETELLHRSIEVIYEEYLSDNAFKGSILQAYLHILLVKFQRLLSEKNQRPPSERTQILVLQFKQLVSKNFLTERTVQFYANQIGISSSYLTAIIKNATGETPGQIIRKAVTLEAKRLLAHSEQTIEQISYQLNFKDPPYFGRFFKRDAGVSPGAFRYNIREKYQKF